MKRVLPNLRSRTPEENTKFLTKQEETKRQKINEAIDCCKEAKLDFEI